MRDTDSIPVALPATPPNHPLPYSGSLPCAILYHLGGVAWFRPGHDATQQPGGRKERQCLYAVPVAFVLGTYVYHIAHQSSMQALRQTGQNQEMVQFTQGVYDAREFALSRMQAEAAAKAPGSSASASTSQTTSGASTPPNSSLPAPPSGVLARSTGCPRLLQSLPSPLASVPERAGVGRFWPPNDAQRRHLLRNTKQHLGRSTARAATAIFSSILRGATLPTEGRREA